MIEKKKKCRQTESKQAFVPPHKGRNKTGGYKTGAESPERKRNHRKGMHGGLSPALRGRQAGAPNVRGPSRPRREPTAITKDKSPPPTKITEKQNNSPTIQAHLRAETRKIIIKKEIKSRTTQAHSKTNRRFETRRARHTSRRGRQKTRTQAQAESLTRRSRRGIRRF